MTVKKQQPMTSSNSSLFTYVLIIFILSLLTRASKCIIYVCLYLHFAKTIVVIITLS